MSADLRTIEKHGCRRTTSNPNEAVGNDAGLGTVKKHGLRSSPSILSASPHSGWAGAITTAFPHSNRAGANQIGSCSSTRSVRTDKL